MVPHCGTNKAALWFTAQIRRDAVFSKSYGRGYTRSSSDIQRKVIVRSHCVFWMLIGFTFQKWKHSSGNCEWIYGFHHMHWPIRQGKRTGKCISLVCLNRVVLDGEEKSRSSSVNTCLDFVQSTCPQYKAWKWKKKKKRNKSVEQGLNLSGS